MYKEVNKLKVWEYLIEQDLLEDKDRVLIEAKVNPVGLQNSMIALFQQYNITMDAIKTTYLKPKDYYNKDVSTWHKLLNLEIYRFTPKVIIGGEQQEQQLTLNEFVKTNLQVIRASN